VQNFAHQEALWEQNSHLLLAVSGGPDSMALLFFFATLQRKYNFTLGVAHINYQLRGTDSTDDALLVKTTCEQLGIPYFEHLSRTTQKSEDALRQIRFQFFQKIAAREGFTRVALAHHQNDQAETLLLRLIRGSGSLGLQAMTPQRGIFIRPFLNTPKKEILDFLTAKNISYRIDASNDELFFLRNKVRHELIPLLEQYNPNIQQTLATTASALATENHLLESYSSVLLETSSKSPDHISFLLSRWQKLSSRESTLCLRFLFTQRGLYPPNQSLIVKLKECFRKSSLGDFPRLRVVVKNDRIHIHFKEL
jgi:tRNA(Ile)-lysidine synthase